MKIFLLTIIIFVSILFYSCVPSRDLEPEDLGRSSTSFLLSVKTVNYKPNQLDFEIDIAHLGELKTVDSFLSFDILKYTFDGLFYPPEIKSTELIKGEKSEPFATAILIDQSTDWKRIDPTSERFSYLRYFLQNMGQEDRVMIAAFARDGLLNQNIISMMSDSFVSGENHVLLKSILDHNFKIGGTCCLYDALYQMIQYMDKHASGNNKSINVLISNPDDGKSDKTLDEIISLAKSKSIKINAFIFNSNYPDWGMVNKFMSTGGFICNNYFRGLMSLNKVLKNDLYFNRLNVTLKHWQNPAPNPFPISLRIDWDYQKSFSSIIQPHLIEFLIEKP